MESTSYISQISYRIEEWLFQGQSIKEIKSNIAKLQSNGKFPKNLELIDAYFDETYSSSGCAFLDTNTGETIVGFAGTNLDNGVIESIKDIRTDVVGLGITGIYEESLYMKEANEFIQKIKEDGYYISQITGHSLGGALSVYIGVYHDIPYVVTYNGAPLYLLPTAELDFSEYSIRKKIEDYDGKVIRFVSNEDWLNKYSDKFDGFYIGEEFTINNDKSHDMSYFLENKEQEFIYNTLLHEVNSFDEDEELSVYFDGDNKIELSIKDLVIKNLLIKNGISGGNGTEVKIDSANFKALKNNLQSKMVDYDINWIRNAITLCKSKNDSLKQNKTKREDTLCNNIVKGLNDAKLTQVISSINNSHGMITNSNNIRILQTLSTFNKYSVTRNLDNWGSSGGRRWFLNGREFDESEVINSIKTLQNSASLLLSETNSKLEYTYYSKYTNKTQVFNYDVISEIGKSFVRVTEGFLSKTEEVFKGTGLRSGKHDGIVNSISEVLEVQNKNIIEIRQQISSVAEAAGGLAVNFSNMDEWLSKSIKSGNMRSSYVSNNISEVYKAYLEENNIFDDVKDVIQAYDLQVETASNNLSKSVVSDFSDITSRTYNKFKKMCNLINDFKSSIKYIEEKMNGNLTSIRKVKIRTGPYYEFEEIEKREYHGTLSQLFPSEVITAIRNAKISIVPLLDTFYDAIKYIENFRTNTYNMKSYLNSVIEKAVYDSMELNSIIKSQNLISMKINTMIKEIEMIDQTIQYNYKGNSLTAYQGQLKKLVQTLRVFDMMINDCFGVQKA